MRYLLFVDDEINILDSLKRSFFRKRSEWDMTFVDSAKAAIEHMENNKVDILITDMKMPEMTGAELLQIAQSSYPHIIRLALSGHADQDLLLESIGLYHQYYTKPCDIVMLEKGINESFELYDILRDESTRDMVTRSKNLPVVPEIYIRIQKLVSKPESTFKDIAKVIEEDMSLSSSIFRLINSPFFGFKETVNNMELAVSLLGIDLIRNMILSVNIFEKSVVDIPEFSLQELMQHSVRVANFCKIIARHEGVAPNKLDKFFIAGLLHDVGKVLFYNNFPEQYTTVISSINESVRSLDASEVQNIGITHAQVGAYLLGLWGFDRELVYAISNHHGCISSEYHESLLLQVVFSANFLDHKLIKINKGYVEREVQKGAHEQFIDEGKFDEWTEVIKKSLEKIL